VNKQAKRGRRNITIKQTRKPQGVGERGTEKGVRAGEKGRKIFAQKPRERKTVWRESEGDVTV